MVTVLTERGLGSGIVYKADGTIVTNAHVVAGAQDITIALAYGQQVPAKVRGADEVSDVAVIQADRNGLPAAIFQKPLPQVGELDVVVGRPLGFEATVTSGIISGLHRQISGSADTGAPLVDLNQTDAAISPGSPLAPSHLTHARAPEPLHWWAAGALTRSTGCPCTPTWQSENRIREPIVMPPGPIESEISAVQAYAIAAADCQNSCWGTKYDACFGGYLSKAEEW